MSEPTKKLRTNSTWSEIEISFPESSKLRFRISKNKAKALAVFLENYRIADEDDLGSISTEEVFKSLHDKYTRPGSCLQAARLKEEMSQVELAKRLGITQSDLSKMENGKRPISKKMAQKLGKILNIYYKVFL